LGPHILYNGNRISPMQLMIMLAIRKEKKYGYEILKELREDFEDIWEPKTGAIYPAIRKLQEHGLVIAETIDGKEYYSLSEEGSVWIAEAVEEVGAHAAMALGFMKVILKAYKEMGFKVRAPCDMQGPMDEERRARLVKLRDSMKMELQRIDDIIEGGGAGDGEHY
jgi:DNA-binding PadR family transcriptional regulator